MRKGIGRSKYYGTFGNREGKNMLASACDIANTWHSGTHLSLLLAIETRDVWHCSLVNLPKGTSLSLKHPGEADVGSLAVLISNRWVTLADERWWCGPLVGEQIITEMDAGHRTRRCEWGPGLAGAWKLNLSLLWLGRVLLEGLSDTSCSVTQGEAQTEESLSNRKYTLK